MTIPIKENVNIEHILSGWGPTKMDITL